MTPTELQQSLFKQVKERLPAHVSLPEELASLLGISADSAYRRIRGEKSMDLGELVQVCSAFGISLDASMGGGQGRFVFSGRFVGSPELPFADWLSGMSAQLEQIASAKDPVFVFRAEDIPTFHFFQIPELTQFKLFFWRRTILGQPDFQDKRFSLAERDEDLLAKARKTFLTYTRLPSTEIWNADSLNAFLRQITFYRDAGLFAREEEAQVLFDKLIELMAHLQAQAEAGVKFMRGEPASTGSAAFKVFINEVMQGDNMIYASAGGQRMAFLNHSAINYVSTTDTAFCDFAQQSLETITRRSILISGTGERERNRFFRIVAGGDRTSSQMMHARWRPTVWLTLLAGLTPLLSYAQTFDLEQFDQLFRPRLRVEARWTPQLAFQDIDAHYEDRSAVGVLTFPICKRWSAGVDLNLRGESAGEVLKNAVRVRASQVMGNARFGTRQLLLDDGMRTLHSASLGALGISLTKKYRILYWSANANLSEEDRTMDKAVPRFTGVIGKMHVKGLRKQFYYGVAVAVSDGFNLPLPFVGGTVPMGDRWSFQYLLPAQLAFGCKASANTRLLAGVGVDGYRSGFALGDDRVNVNYTAVRGFVTVRHRLSRAVQVRAEVTGLPLHSIRLPDDEGDLQRYRIEPGVQFMAGVNLFFGQSTFERLLEDVLK